ncbi:docking protein 3 isoform X1 [Sceloporus undulatus]|uniref:docking protein 3 isoform X1 n=1 Tax=Sceloporus undulatus TaxID=8520 RepID=UPI001C4BBF55|nr:docking protein 3 isoform X1 [Sceloporus undulatus]
MMERSYFLAADQPDEWIECICKVAFQRTPAPCSTMVNTPSPQPLMEENTIYSSWQETWEYPVAVFPTEASARCHLKGNYLIVPLREQLVLKDVQSGKAIYTWPYAFLRRFGQEKTIFSFEAGRRCSSGEGLFTFSTVRAAEICTTISAAIDRQKAILLMDGDKKAGLSAVPDSMQKSSCCPWPTNMESLEEKEPLYERTPVGLVDVGLPAVPPSDSFSASPEKVAPELPIIYASIGKSFPPLFQPCGMVEAEPKEQRGQLSDHLYENLCALEQQRALQSESLGFSYRDSLEGSGSISTEPSPIYDNSPVAAKRSSSHPCPSPTTGADSSPEIQHPPHPLDYQEAARGSEGNTKPKARGAGAFRHRLVTMLSRDTGTPKTISKNTSATDKS